MTLIMIRRPRTRLNFTVFPSILAFAGLMLLSAIVPEVSPDPPQDTLAKDLKSKDANVRLAAARQVAESGGEDAEKALTRLLKDDDWEVMIVACEGLGRHGGEKSVDTLVKLAYDGPIRYVRASAADAVAQLDPNEAAKSLGKKLKKDTALAACQALVRIAPSLQGFEAPKGLKKLLGDKNLRVRAAASGAMVALSREDRAEVIESLLGSEHLAVRASALEVAAEQPRTEQVQPILSLLEEATLSDVVQRRALPALAAGIDCIEKNPGETFESSLAALCSSKEASVARRGPLLARLALEYDWGQRLDLVASTKTAREHDDPGVRASAAFLLRFLGADQGLETAHGIYAADSSVRVRRAAFESILELQPITTDETRTWIIEQLGKEGSAELREVMVVALGSRELTEQGDAVQALIDSLQDSNWAVACCAAVSLGLTRSEFAVEPLEALVREAPGWRLRGAAVVGLSKCLQKDGIDSIIAALADDEPLVARTAHSYLLSIARGEVIPPEIEAWATWWSEKQDKLRLLDPRDQQERNKKYGYEATPEQVYRGLDVVVLESRGDRIQEIFERLGIVHRMTISNRIKQDGLDPSGVFVSNCTGEMEVEDLERLDWFVKVGGYLCGSCWAVTETIAKIEPGVVAKVATRDQVMDNVLSTSCAPDSPYTKGVFGKHVVPIYRLEGAHLIRVLQPERVEMLVDSVECAEKWGGGNLACWFTSGHGTILDSANHFNLQGFEYATYLKKPEQRMAYAVDHMGTSFERIRETEKERFWSSNNKAGEQIFDDSVFRLVTNFVRLRRLEGR
jgi:HEAT repeat protein